MSRDAFSGGAAGAAGRGRAPHAWRRYKERDDGAARDRIILTFAPLVKYVASHMRSALPSTWTRPTSSQYGLVG